MPRILRRFESLLVSEQDGCRGSRLREPLPETYFHPREMKPTSRVLEEARRLVAGEFRPAANFDRTAMELPPQWDANPFHNDNWVSNLHGLEWVLPLFIAEDVEPGRGYHSLAVSVVEDWIRRNPFRRAPSRFSWHDHATAKRLRLLAWFWERHKRAGSLTGDSERLVLASVYQHALYHMDDRNYRPNSNHGLEGIGALAAAAITFPIFRDAASWERKAMARLSQWMCDNISPEGFHLEQSTSYHWFVLARLAMIDRFLRANGRSAAGISSTVERMAGVWPYLIQPNGRLPATGDSGRRAPRDWRLALASHWGRHAPPPRESIMPGGHGRGTALMVSPIAGYAILMEGEPDKHDEMDTYVLFRCRAFESPHAHQDALSFVLYGIGQEWIVDPGYLSYEEADPRRQYLRSPRAHSLVLMGGYTRGATNGSVDWGREDDGDYVMARREMDTGEHARRVLLRPARVVIIEDRVRSTSRGPLAWRQLFQIACGLAVEVKSGREAHLVSPDGSRCVVRQSAPGEWRAIRGQEQPCLQGWYSERFGHWVPSYTLSFAPAAGTAELRSEVRLVSAEQEL